MRKPALLALALVLAAGPLSASTWSLDAAHSEIAFETTHLGIAKVRGRFTEANATINLDDKDLTKSTVEISIPVKSISTNNAKRDSHLLGGDFFEAEAHPNITFKATKIKKAGKGYKVTAT